LRARIGDIEKLIRQHAQWVFDKLDNWPAKHAKEALVVRDGTVISLFGEPLTVTVTAIGRPRWQFAGDKLHLWPSAMVNANSLLEKALREKARTIFLERLSHYAPLLGVYGVGWLATLIAACLTVLIGRRQFSKTADALLIVGSHVRWEAPLLNARLRKAAKRGAKVFVVGPQWDATYPVTNLGNDLAVLDKLPKAAADAFKAAQRPALILGGAGLGKGALGACLALAEKYNLVREGWNGFNVVHMAASRMGGLMLGYAQTGGIADLVAAKPKLVISLGADEVDYTKFAGSMIVYIGHHGDKGAHAADIILPAAAFSEKAGTYVNTEGRVQMADKAVFAPGDAREDWTILRAMADSLGVTVGFDSFDELRGAMVKAVPALGTEGLADYGALPKAAKGVKAEGVIEGYPIKDFYLTNPVARASVTMQRCSAELLHGENFAEAAE
jgi:NADH dehydrogenase/NADH:ubiquinone oxidoreductase subunit G